MIDIINKCLLVGDKLMPEMHLRQPGFTYSACGTFTKKKEKIKKFIQTGDTNFIYKNGLNKACYQHDMAYGKGEDLVRRTQSDKVLRDKAFNFASDPKYYGYQRGLASIVYKFVDKKFKKRKVYSSFRDNIWGVDLADMQSQSRYNKKIKYLLCAIDLFSKYAWVVPMKDKKDTSLVNAFKKIISEGRKPNKIWVDQGSEF